MDLSYREKRIWISLSTQLVCYLIYFVELHHGVGNIAILVHAILAILVLQVLLQAILALTARPEPKDERDIAVERIAYRNAYWALFASVSTAMAWLAIAAFHLSHGHPPRLGAFHILNGLLVLLLVAEIAKLVSQLVSYRRTA